MIKFRDCVVLTRVGSFYEVLATILTSAQNRSIKKDTEVLTPRTVVL